jgi:hypothetical protein
MSKKNYKGSLFDKICVLSGYEPVVKYFNIEPALKEGSC